MSRSKLQAAFCNPSGNVEGAPPSSVLGAKAASMVLETGGGSGVAAGCTHSVLPSVVMTKRCVPKHIVVPGTQETIVVAIRRVLDEVERRRASPLPSAPTVGVSYTG